MRRALEAEGGELWATGPGRPDLDWASAICKLRPEVESRAGAGCVGRTIPEGKVCTKALRLGGARSIGGTKWRGPSGAGTVDRSHST